MATRPSLLASVRAVAARMSGEPDVFEVVLEPRRPAGARALRDAERRLGVELPAELRAIQDEGGLSFAWSIRAEGAKRLGDDVDADTLPSTQVEVWPAASLRRWDDTPFAVVVGDGAGNGIALDVEAQAAGKKPYTWFDHDDDAASGPRFATLAEFAARAARKGFFWNDEADLPPRLLAFLRGKPLPAAKQPKPPRAAPRARALPAEVALKGGDQMVWTIAAVDDQRVASASNHAVDVRLHAIGRAAPLARWKLDCYPVRLLAAGDALIAAGSGPVARIDLDSGAVSRATEGGVFVRDAARTERWLALGFGSAITVEPARSPGARAAEVKGGAEQLAVIDDERLLGLGWNHDATGITLAVFAIPAALGEARRVASRDLAISPSRIGAALLATRHGPRLALADDTLLCLDGALRGGPSRFAKGLAVSGPGVVLPGGEEALVARYVVTRKGKAFDVVIDRHRLDDGARLDRRKIEGAPDLITAMAVTPDGARLVVGGVSGWLRSIAI